MKQTDWMNDPRLDIISKEKLDFLQELFNESKKVPEGERLMYFSKLSKKIKTCQIQFSKEELQLLTTVIRSQQNQNH